LWDKKDNFHIFIFVLTKRQFLIPLLQESSQIFLFPKGVVDGERPLKTSPAIRDFPSESQITGSLKFPL
jgi:hypothetical protein